MLPRILSNPRFALAELLLVVLSGVAWILAPEVGVWFTLIAILPWVLRFVAGKPVFQRTPLDVPVALLLVTAWVGYWAAYDQSGAWIKAWLIVTAILLYYALSAQPKQNLGWLSLFSFSLGLCISIYFFLTHNFSVNPGSITAWWMEYRPQLGWTAIHHGYTSGLLVITNLFAIYGLWDIKANRPRRLALPVVIFLVLGFGVMALTFVLTVSRGVWMALVCGLGVWVIWKVVTSARFKTRPGIRSLFPLFVLVYLCAILVITYLGPEQAPEGPSNFGSNSRAEVFDRGLSFLRDYPITGGGLNSFPGLYSHYILVIPSFYFTNSYNTFLDVAVEQGIIGGLAFLLIYMGSIWLVSSTIIISLSQEIRFLGWLGLFALLFSAIHGFFYDYLYNGNMTALLLFPVGFSMIGVLDTRHSRTEILDPSTRLAGWKPRMPVILITALGIVLILVLNVNKIISVWYSDLGAVRMSQVELKHFPANEWATSESVLQLAEAEKLLHTSLQYNPENATANYRLGLISLLRQDFANASARLEAAYKQTPGHRGIIKNLGYDYGWLGKMEEAQKLLVKIPEAQEELNVYVWWWTTQGQRGLARKAFLLASSMQYVNNQP